MNTKEVAAVLRGKGFERIIEGNWMICATTLGQYVVVSASFRPGLTPVTRDLEFPQEVVRELTGDAITPEVKIERDTTDDGRAIWKWSWADPSIGTSPEQTKAQVEAVAKAFFDHPEPKPKPQN